MKTRSQRVISVLLTVLMIICMVPFAGISSFAAVSGDYTYEINSGAATITIVSNDVSGAVSIPATLGDVPVTAISSYAFDGCQKMTSVLIPASVKSISSVAFINCRNLTGITVDNANSYFSTDTNGVLFNKDKSKLLYFPMGNKSTSYAIASTVLSIGSYAFYACSNLKSVTIPTSVKTIEKAAFSYCYGLESLSLPVSVSSIGYEAFKYCNSLKSITVETYNQTYSSDKSGALFNKNKSTLILFPASSELTEYTVPASVTSVDYAAFYANKNLETVTFAEGSRLKNIGKEAFASCSSLKKVEFAENTKLETINANAFENCVSLTQFSIPESVTEVLSYAFSGCTKLADMYIYNSKCLLSAGMCSASPTLTIHGYSNSTASKYARENSIKFISIDGGTEDETTTKPGGSIGTDTGDEDDNNSSISIGSIFERLIAFFKLMLSYILKIFGL